LQQSPPDEVEGLFQRDPQQLKVFRGETMAQHWKRLNAVRDQLIHAYGTMSLEDFQRTRTGSDIFCSAEWVAHELCQFEAERRADIAFMLAGARKALNPSASE
jgi:hypothetical protein